MVDLLIKAIVDNYSYSFAQWQPDRIKDAIDLIAPDISTKLDYSGSNNLIESIRSEFGDITPYIVKHNYPVWVDTSDPIPSGKRERLVITYIPPDKDSFLGCVENIKQYSSRINADCVILSGRTQGSLLLEKPRIKKFVETYGRTIFLNYNLLLKDDCPDLFDIVPEDKVGLHDNAVKLLNFEAEIKRYKKRRLMLLKAESFNRFPVLTQGMTEPLEFECEQINTMYSNNVVVCSKQHAGIWNPIFFPFQQAQGEDQIWMETVIYRDGYDVFTLPEDLCLHESVFDGVIQDDITKAKIVSYKNFVEEPNVVNTWIYDNNIIGYKDKPELDMSEFSILCLGHKEEQLKSIRDRDYLSKVNMNELKTNFGNEFAEGRIYDIDFDSLFPVDKKYVGLVTVSWNQKYIGLNPIDEFHQWAGSRQLNDESVMCANTEPSLGFIYGNLPIMTDVLKMGFEKSKELLELVGLEVVDKITPISNQIIATRNIVKRLFDFYQNNDVLNRIDYFIRTNNITANKAIFDPRKQAYLSELITLFWIANQDFTILPQEIRKIDWYW